MSAILDVLALRDSTHRLAFCETWAREPWLRESVQRLKQRVVDSEPARVADAYEFVT